MLDVSPPMSRHQRIELLVFIATFFAFAYFHQGGGWNQNSRFAEVRAMAEQGRFAIDDFLLYEVDPQTEDLRRIPMQNAEYEAGGKRHRLAWVDMVWTLASVNAKPADDDTTLEPMISMCSSGDIGYVPATGHFHPNKPPGTSFIALPGYWIIYQIERLLGVNPDAWRVITFNAWLTSVCSVGLLSALGCVLFFRLARHFAGGAAGPAAAATIAFAFGTTYFPFGTLLFDHNLTAALLLAAFYFLRLGKPCARVWMLAGMCAGMAAVTNYVAAVAGAFLGLYALLATAKDARNWRAALHFSLGVLPPFLLICWYDWVNFGSPFRLANDFQNPLFKDPDGALGMFQMPSAYVAALISVSPYRGIFFLAPILILGVWGLVAWLRERTFTAEARLCLAIFGFFFLVNASFNGYHGGFSAGPRYLVPALPFLALPLVVAFTRWRIFAWALAIISIGQQLVLTATDAQNPLAVGGHARNDRKQDFLNNIVLDYAWPLLAHGRAWPMLDELLAVHLDKARDKLEADGATADEIETRIGTMERELHEGMVRGEASPFLLAAIEGPVSVNPIGIFEGLLEFRHFDPRSEPVRWASFNVGEFLWPESRWSLLPMLLISGGLCGWLLSVAGASSRGTKP